MSLSDWLKGKRAGRDRARISTAAFYYLLILAAAYSPVVFFGYSLQPSLFNPFGVLDSGTWGYAGRLPVNIFNLDHADAAYTMWPINKLVGELLRMGEAPLWNPWQGAGEPLAAQYSTRVFAPYQILENLSPTAFWDYFLLGRLWLGAVFAFMFLRELKVSGVAAFAGGLFFMFSGAFVWFIWLEQMLNVTMLLPLLFLTARRVALPGNAREVALAAVVLAMALLGGQPETALYAIVSAAIYLLFLLYPMARHQVLYALARYAFAGLLGLALAAPLLILFWEHFGLAFSLHPPGGDMGVRDVMSVARMPAIFFPTLYNLPRPFTFTPLNGLWDHVGGYVGVTIAVLVVFGLFEKRHPWRREFLFFFGLGLFLILKHLGVPPFLWIGYLPLFDQVWSYRWAGGVWVFAFSMAAALAVNALSGAPASAAAEGAVAPPAPPAKAPPDGTAASLFLLLASLAALVVFAHPFVRPVADWARYCVTAAIGAASLLLILSGVHGRRFPNIQSFCRLWDRFCGRWKPWIVIPVVALAVAPAGWILLATLRSSYQYSLLAGGTALFLATLPVAVLGAGWVISPRRTTAWMGRDMGYRPAVWAMGLVVGAFILAMANYPALLAEQEPYFIANAFLGGWVGLASGAAALALLIRRRCAPLAGIGLVILAANEMIFAIPRGYEAADAALKLLPWFLGLIVVWGVVTQRRVLSLAAAGVAVVSLAAIDLAAERGWPKRHDPFSAAPFVEFLKQTSGLHRSAGFGGVVFGNFASALQLQDVHSIQALSIASFQHFSEHYLQDAPGLSWTRLWFTGYPARAVRDIDPCHSLWFWGFVPIFPKNEYPSKLALERVKNDIWNNLAAWSFMGVRYFLLPKWADLDAPADSRYRGEADMRLLYDGEIRIFENPGVLPRAFMVHAFDRAESFMEAQKTAFSPGYDLVNRAVVEGELPPHAINGGRPAEPGKVTVTHYSSRRIDLTVETDQDGLVVLTDNFYPGWEATVDGLDAKMLRVNGLTRGLWVEAGKHRIVTSYRPPGFALGMALAALAAAVCLILVLASRKR